MGDPDKNPNIYGTTAYRDRVAEDIDIVKRGWGTPSTREGRAVAKQLEQAKKKRETPPPVINTPPVTSAFPPAPQLPMPVPRSRQQKTTTSEGKSQPLLMNLACALVGFLAAVFVSAHGMKSGLALATAFSVGFAGSRLLISYMKYLVGIALLGFLLYEIVHATIVH